MRRSAEPRPRQSRHRQHRRRLRRYRHEPALRASRGRQSPPAGPIGVATPAAVLGVLSLILWALIFIVTFKYVIVPAARRQQRRGRHADPDGAARAQVTGDRAAARGDARDRRRGAVLWRRADHARRSRCCRRSKASRLVTPGFDPYIVPLTVAILVALFAVQSRGTASVAAFFGPIMAVWFFVIAIAGRSSGSRAIPSVLLALQSRSMRSRFHASATASSGW